MVEILNGRNDLPLAGWMIVICQGQTLLGAPDLIGVLRPVYSMTCVMQMVQQSPRHPPQLATMRSVTPLLTYPSLSQHGIPMPVDAIVLPVESLSKDERRALAKSVEQCEHMCSAMRAEGAGVTLVPPGARLT